MLQSISLLCFLSAITTCCSASATASCYDSSCAAPTEEVEYRELEITESAKVELLQKHRDVSRGRKIDPEDLEDPEVDGPELAIGGDRHYLLVRPCARLAGDGISGLPRHRVTGECCGDGMCTAARWENDDTCPQDCQSEPPKLDTQVDQSATSKKILPPAQTKLFGELPGMEHDEYHCEGMYDADPNHKCSNLGEDSVRKHKLWLQDLLDRTKAGTLPFDLPPAGSIAVEIGAGLGQDSRNLAEMAGYSVTAVDVSPSALEIAKNATDTTKLGTGPGQIQFVAYDAMALPSPRERVDFFFDATVYCSLRHEYLARVHELLSRIATPGHTLVNIQCWNLDTEPTHRVARAGRDMEADFEPIFDILHSEECKKNQGGVGWCFYMKLKPFELRTQLFEHRLKMQKAARDGDVEYIDTHAGNLTVNEMRTLFYIALDNGHSELQTYLKRKLPEEDEPALVTLYGWDANADTIASDDLFDSSKKGKRVDYLKLAWERAEALARLPVPLRAQENSTSS